MGLLALKVMAHRNCGDQKKGGGNLDRFKSKLK